MTGPTNRPVLLACAAGTLTLMTALPVRAEGGTPQQRMACMSDAMTYCAAVIPDETKIEACLRRRRARISVACRAVLDEVSGSDPGVAATYR